MIIYRKRSENKRQLATQHARDFEANKECPACRGALKIAETQTDRVTYICTKCGEVATFTAKPLLDKPPKSTKMNALTLRDRTTQGYRGKRSNFLAVPKDLKKTIDEIKKAMDDTCVISFEYTSADGSKSARSAEPYKLTLKSGEPILYGFDLDAGSIRVFKLAGIASLEIQQYLFKPRWNMEDKLNEG